jgi:hypothetical protein
MAKKGHDLTRLHQLAIFVVLMVVLTVARLYPVYQYSVEPYSYNGYLEYRTKYLLANGHSLPPERGEVLSDKIEAIRFMLLPLSPEMDLLLVSLVQSLVLALGVLLVYRRYRRQDKPSGLAASLLVMAFAVSSSPNIVSQLVGLYASYASIFFTLSAYYLICARDTFRNKSLGLLFLLLLPLTYFTMALFLVIVVVVAIGYQAVTRRRLLSSTLLAIYVVFFVAWTMYVSMVAFGEVLGTFDKIELLLSKESRVLTLEFVQRGSFHSIALYGASFVLVCLPLAYFAWTIKRYDRRLQHFFLVLVISVVPVGLGLYLFMGFNGVIQRIPGLTAHVSIVFSAIFCASQLPKTWKFHRGNGKVFVLCLVTAIVLANYIHVTTEYNSIRISVREASGIDWLMSHTTSNDTVFSDFRISGPLTANGYDPLIVNDEFLTGETVNLLLRGIYYNSSNPLPSILLLCSLENRSCDYLVFSQRSADYFPGVMGYDYNFRNASRDFLVKYSVLSELHQVMDNGEIVVFSRP